MSQSTDQTGQNLPYATTQDDLHLSITNYNNLETIDNHNTTCITQTQTLKTLKSVYPRIPTYLNKAHKRI